MWQKIRDSEYFLLIKQDHVYQICVTDYISVWTVFYDLETFIARLKESNEGLELDNDHEFILKGLYMLYNMDKVNKATITKEDNGNNLLVYIKKTFGFPFYLTCTLNKGSEELFFTKVTQSLLKTIGNLKCSESELRRLLIKKDKEIEEYKSEGGEIVYRHLKTAAFNDLQHMNEYNTYKEIFGPTNIPTSLLEKSVQSPVDYNMQCVPTLTPSNVNEEPASVTQEAPTIKEEPVDIKQEPDSAREEPASIKEEPASTQEEPVFIKQEPVGIKQEQNTPTPEELTAPIIPSVSCKQEVKTEWASNETNYKNPRKRMKKLNY